MKKLFLTLAIIFLLAVASFAAGAFLSWKKSGYADQKVINNSSQKEKISNNESGDELKNENETAPPISPESEVPDPSLNNEEKKFSFAILGDTQYFKPGNNGNFNKAAGSIKKINPDFVFGIGDLVSSCDGGSECERKLNSWKNTLSPFKAYPMQGNHDRTGKEKADPVWQKVFSYLPSNGPEGFQKFTYSFDFENSHFAVLDSDKPKEYIVNETQRSWLDRDLSATQKENIFVFFHEPAYPTNSKIDESLDVNAKDRDALWNILASHKVTAVFSGHEHIQSRRKVNGLYQFVFGNVESFNHEAPKPGMAEYSYIGPAFGMVEVNGKEITVKTLGIGGDTLNSFSFSK